ncbi:MAG: hypothetical protein WCV79_04250 [Candidatus Paceibacterota bacterium]|jgi:hypothetical protein
MTVLARIEIECDEDEHHHLSLWEPGDEEACGAEHVVYGPGGIVICYEDHEAELALTIADLTGETPFCFQYVNEYLGESKWIEPYFATTDEQEVLFRLHLYQTVDTRTAKAAAISAVVQGHKHVIQFLEDHDLIMSPEDIILTAARFDQINLIDDLVALRGFVAYSRIEKLRILTTARNLSHTNAMRLKIDNIKNTISSKKITFSR